MIIEDEILSIEPIGVKDTIDITTDGNHLFFANDILSHNSGWDTSEIRMDQVGESAGIVHNADFILALWQVEGDREACRLNTTVIKSRYGMVGKADEYYVNYNTLRVSDQDKADTISVTETNELEDFVEELEKI